MLYLSPKDAYGSKCRREEAVEVEVEVEEVDVCRVYVCVRFACSFSVRARVW